MKHLLKRVETDFHCLADVIVKQPVNDEEQKFQGMVGLEELAKTDRLLVQQVSLSTNHSFLSVCNSWLSTWSPALVVTRERMSLR